MSRFVTNSRKKVVQNEQSDGISVAILSAGCGSKIKSYEPRSLLKINNEDYLIDYQLETIANFFVKPEIITVVGCYANKVIKKIKGKCRIVENQMYEETNASESMRLALNNSSMSSFMFIHGDILFDANCLNAEYSHSFIITDSKKMIGENEIGVTIVDNKASIMSYGLPTKWAQIAFFTGKELKILNGIFQRFEEKDRKKLSFEIINEVISNGGVFHCYEPNKMKIKEIDTIKDIE